MDSLGISSNKIGKFCKIPKTLFSSSPFSFFSIRYDPPTILRPLFLPFSTTLLPCKNNHHPRPPPTTLLFLDKFLQIRSVVCQSVFRSDRSGAFAEEESRTSSSLLLVVRSELIWEDDGRWELRKRLWKRHGGESVAEEGKKTEEEKIDV